MCQQLRKYRNFYTIAGCIAVPLCMILHYRYLTGVKVTILSDLAVYMEEWEVYWKHIVIVLVAYLPVMICFGLRACYEGRRVKMKKM